MQSGTAFHQVRDGLSFFRNVYDEFASYRAAIVRLDGLAQENSHSRAFSQATTASADDGTLVVDGVDVYTPDGYCLVHGLDLRLDPGDTLLIRGPSASARRFCCRASPDSGPSSPVRLPAGRAKTMFVPQLPYIPLGDLRAVVSYPHEEGAVDDQQIQRAPVSVSHRSTVDHFHGSHLELVGGGERRLERLTTAG